MSEIQGILELARQNNGMVTTTMVVQAGYSRGCLKYLSDSGNLEKAARGVYTLPEAWGDEFVNIQNRYKRGIYSLDTALFLNGLTDRTPLKFNMTFPSTYNLSNPRKDGLLCKGTKEPYYSLGVTDLITPGDNAVRGYCAEKTLCDILKPVNHVDIQVVTDAFRQYVSQKEKNIPLLSEYAGILKVGNRLRSYLEVLL